MTIFTSYSYFSEVYVRKAINFISKKDIKNIRMTYIKDLFLLFSDNREKFKDKNIMFGKRNILYWEDVEIIKDRSITELYTDLQRSVFHGKINLDDRIPVELINCIFSELESIISEHNKRKNSDNDEQNKIMTENFSNIEEEIIKHVLEISQTQDFNSLENSDLVENKIAKYNILIKYYKNLPTYGIHEGNHERIENYNEKRSKLFNCMIRRYDEIIKDSNTLKSFFF